MDFIILFLIGVTATTVGTMAGSGGLISMPAMLLIGVPVHSVIGANKISNTISSFSSFFYLLNKGEISLKESFWIIPVSICGGMSGGFIATRISGENMYIIAVILLIFSLVVSFIGKGNFAGEESLRFNKISASGLYSIGIYDGLFGPGQGTLMMYLFGHLHIAYIRAVALVRLATFSSCFGAAITYVATGKVIWGVTLALLLGSLTGAQIGVRIAEKIRPSYVKPILRGVTIALILQIIWSNL